jgi:hypothetical protein
MANEAIPVEGPYEVHDFTVAVATGIPQFTLCQITDPRTASATSGDSEQFAGIAFTEKVANNGVLNLGLATTGTWVLKDNGGAGIAEGALVSVGGANTIKAATEAEVIAGDVIGKALEAIASGTSGEVKLTLN